MRKNIAFLIAICSPVLGALHATLYEEWRTWVESKWGLQPFMGKLLTSLAISGIGIASVCFLGWVVWRFWSWHRRRTVRRFYWSHVEGLIDFLQTFRDEIGYEIALFERLDKLRHYPVERWKKLKYSYDIHVKGNNLKAVSRRIERCLRSEADLMVIRELREPIVGGLKRVATLLGGSGTDVVIINRAQEMVEDLADRHLEQLRRSLANL